VKILILIILEIIIAEENESSSTSISKQQEEQFKVYENFITGMLKTFPSLPKDKIHTMMSIYMDTYNLSIEQLELFLTNLVKQEKVEFSSGVYSKK
jgi:anaphase-promoting complex subunit 2